jgi:hypothetical protein
MSSEETIPFEVNTNHTQLAPAMRRRDIPSSAYFQILPFKNLQEAVRSFPKLNYFSSHSPPTASTA